MEKTATLHCSNCACLKNNLFKKCVTEELNKLQENKIIRSFKKGQALFLEGEKAFALFCINKGSVKIIKQESCGKEQIIKIVRPGDNLGYHAIISNTSYNHSAIAISDVQVCVVPKQDYLDMIKTNHTAADELIQKISSDYIEAEETIKIISIKSARERLANAILDNTDNTSSVEEPILTISRSDLANIVGAAKETTARLLTELKEERVITTEGKNIRVLNKEKLQKLKGLYEGKTLPR